MLRPSRTLKHEATHRRLADSPLLHRLHQDLLWELHLCSHASLSRAAFALNVFAQQRCFRPSTDFLAALDTDLQSRLAAREPTEHSLPDLVANALHAFRCCAQPASAALQECVAAWLLEPLPGAAEQQPACSDIAAPGVGKQNPGRRGVAEAGADEQAAVRSSMAKALTPRQAQKILRSWVAFAANPGAPARETLHAILQALTPRIQPYANHTGGAAGVLQRALTDTILAAPSVQAISDVGEAVGGEHFNHVHACAALASLARL